MDEKSLKPQLRFKEFTDAWEQRKFQDMFSFERPDPYIVKSDKYSNEYTMPVLTANKAFVLGYTKENSPCKKTSLIFDDFTLECKYVDFPYMVKSSAIKILTVKDEKKDNLRFSFERLNTTKIEILGHARHYISVVQPTKTRTPNILEQNKISELFSNLDNLITLHQRKLDKLSNVKKALLEKMFPKNDSDVPEIRFKGFTDAWEQRKLSKIATMHARIGWQNLRKSEFLDSGDYYLITGTDFDDGKIDLKNCHYVAKERYEQDKNIQVKNGSILITKDGTLGKVAYVSNLQKPATLNAGVFNVELLTEDTDRKYLFQYLKAPFLMSYVSQKATGGTIKHLNQNILVDFPVIRPKKIEQQKIGTFFSNLDNLITLHQRKLEKLKNIKKACLEKMFV